MIKYCECGCGIEVTNLYVLGHNRRGKKHKIKEELLYKWHQPKSEEFKKKLSIYFKGDGNPMRNPRSREKLKKPKSEEGRKNIREAKQKIEVRNFYRDRMLNGGSSYAASFITNPSKPQVELFKLVKQLCHCAILNYPLENKSLDIAIPFHKIAIEYDGSYWHPDEEKDNERQKQIESLGWKFIRYRDYIPSLKELEENIQNEILR